MNCADLELVIHMRYTNQYGHNLGDTVKLARQLSRQFMDNYREVFGQRPVDKDGNDIFKCPTYYGSAKGHHFALRSSAKYVRKFEAMRSRREGPTGDRRIEFRVHSLRVLVIPVVNSFAVRKRYEGDVHQFAG
ncbi:hypothetical protein BKA93DRAFT_752478 [Sparassis latifolia]